MVSGRCELVRGKVLTPIQWTKAGTVLRVEVTAGLCIKLRIAGLWLRRFARYASREPAPCSVASSLRISLHADAAPATSRDNEAAISS